MSMTLLEMVQNIASAVDADDVNSISDTVEAYQIARVVEETYYEVLAALKIPSKESLIQLEGLTDTAHPNYLKIPDTVKKINWVKYDYESLGKQGDYVDVVYLEPELFIARTINNAGASNSPPSTLIQDFSGAYINVVTTFNPTYWTTFDNEYLVFDSYQSSVDTTLQSSKSLSFGQNNLAFTVQDDFIPALDDDLFPLLLAEAKTAAFNNIKQMPAPVEEKRARRQLIRIQNDLWRADQRTPASKTPDYGRRRLGVNPLGSTRNPANSGNAA